jgi:hypothetical protein
MRCLIPFLILLAGCATVEDPSKVSPVPVPEAINLDEVGRDLDVIDSRVAASVVVSRELIKDGKPGKADQELSIAQSLLPKPSDGDVAVSRQRSEKATDAEYEAQRKKAETRQKEVEDAWKTLEGQVIKNKEAIKAKDDRIAELTTEVKRVKASAAAQTWTWIGGALAVAGALATAFLSPKVGLSLIGCGMLCGAVPFIIESQYFSVIVAVTLSGGAALLLWFLWDLVRDRVNAKQPPSA